MAERKSKKGDFMEEKCVSNPKVFISYAWGRNKDRAKELADRLLADGVQVTIDVYDLKPGMNKHKFMQQLVNDPEVKKVLLLCDEEYKRKADDFEGGVGEETTIISPEVYGNVDQTKFIPVVLEKDGNGKPYLPTMLKSLMYIDFCKPDSDLTEYHKLVRDIWGVPEQIKPPVAERPAWIDNSSGAISGIESGRDQKASAIRPAPTSGVLQTRIAQKTAYFEPLRTELHRMLGRILWYADRIEDVQFNWTNQPQSYWTRAAWGLLIQHPEYKISQSAVVKRCEDIKAKYAGAAYDALPDEKKAIVSQMHRILYARCTDLANLILDIKRDRLLLSVQGFMPLGDVDALVFNVTFAMEIMSTKNGLSLSAIIDAISRSLAFVEDDSADPDDQTVGLWI